MSVASPQEHEVRPAARQPSAPAPPSPVATAPTAAPLTPTAVLQLQRSAGNAALVRMLASPPRRQLQRCGASCRCTTCSDEELPEERLPRVLARKPAASVRKGDKCEPERRISGIVFVPWRDEEVVIANKAVEGSKKALANQSIALDLEVKPFLELGNLNFSDENDSRTVKSYDQVCAMMEELEYMRSKPGVVVLVVPISGEVCGGHGQACYVGDLKDRCPALKYTRRLIIVGRFMSESDLGEVLAHELGHHAGRPQRHDPTTYGHEAYDNDNYMNFGSANRNHYRSELLDRMCGLSFQF